MDKSHSLCKGNFTSICNLKSEFANTLPLYKPREPVWKMNFWNIILLESVRNYLLMINALLHINAIFTAWRTIFIAFRKGKEFLFQRRMAAHKSFCIPGRNLLLFPPCCNNSRHKKALLYCWCLLCSHHVIKPLCALWNCVSL